MAPILDADAGLTVFASQQQVVVLWLQWHNFPRPGPVYWPPLPFSLPSGCPSPRAPVGPILPLPEHWAELSPLSACVPQARPINLGPHVCAAQSWRFLSPRPGPWCLRLVSPWLCIQLEHLSGALTLHYSPSWRGGPWGLLFLFPSPESHCSARINAVNCLTNSYNCFSSSAAGGGAINQLRYVWQMPWKHHTQTARAKKLYLSIVHLSIYLSISVYIYVFLSIAIYISISTYLSTYTYIYIYI